MKLSKLVLTSLLFLLLSTISLPLGYAEAVNAIEQVELKEASVPVEKKKKRSKKKLKKRKKQGRAPESENGGITANLYLTFAVMALLPLLVIGGVFIVAFGFPLLYLFMAGVALILAGNIAAIIAGVVAGASKTYTTQVLSFALWIFFGINLAAGALFLVMNLVLFIGWPIFWILAIGLLCIALAMLIWLLIIRKQNKDLRNKKAKEEEALK